MQSFQKVQRYRVDFVEHKRKGRKYLLPRRSIWNFQDMHHNTIRIKAASSLDAILHGKKKISILASRRNHQGEAYLSDREQTRVFVCLSIRCERTERTIVYYYKWKLNPIEHSSFL